KVKRNLIEIKGEPKTVDAGRRFPVITDLYVPVGARSFHVDSAEGFTTGDTILVRREGNSDFIRAISMDSIKPRPGSPDGTKQWEPFALEFDRVITAIDGNLITIDAQVAAAIESRWGGGSVLPYTDAGRIEQVGVENLKAVAEYDSSVVLRQGEQEYYGDEQHALGFVLFDHVKNAWVQNFVAFHFSFFTVHVDRGAKWVTVQNGETRDMVSVITGGRRYPYFISGQLSLFRNVRAETARHAFVVGSRVCGPNVFLSGVSTQNYGSSEPHHRWSVGGLFDQIEGSIAIQDRQYFGSGHGWSGANYVAWNTTGDLVVQKPPTAHNWSFGHVGQKGREAFPPREQGSFASFGQCMKPDSLYLQQLKERLGQQVVESLEE
ncbi:MAG: hypothetical protein JWN30_2253, partial [Bacilli bacterium]|nr:hypothetical protein [Bacilli bacterium]